jgi:hypothetical protein
MMSSTSKWKDLVKLFEKNDTLIMELNEIYDYLKTTTESSIETSLKCYIPSEMVTHFQKTYYYIIY